MPLHRDDEVFGRGTFDRFDHIVLGTPCRHSQPVSHLIRRLVMTRVHPDLRCPARIQIYHATFSKNRRQSR